MLTNSKSYLAGLYLFCSSAQCFHIFIIAFEIRIRVERKKWNSCDLNWLLLLFFKLVPFNLKHTHTEITPLVHKINEKDFVLIFCENESPFYWFKIALRRKWCTNQLNLSQQKSFLQQQQQNEKKYQLNSRKFM